jgi:hypothetical protein
MVADGGLQVRCVGAEMAGFRAAIERNKPRAGRYEKTKAWKAPVENRLNASMKVGAGSGP